MDTGSQEYRRQNDKADQRVTRQKDITTNQNITSSDHNLGRYMDINKNQVRDTIKIEWKTNWHQNKSKLR